MKRNEYYSLSKRGQNVTLNIYGDISKYKYDWNGESFGSPKLAEELRKYENIENIDVFINSNGGSVSEGLAVYNILKRQNAKVTTYCDGFACSAASVIFMAGDERIMSNASLLMIHNAWIYTEGNAEELRKQADDLDIITEASINAYLNHVNISREELKLMLDRETWIDCDEALEKGFCTKIIQEERQVANQSVSMKVLQMLKNSEKRGAGEVAHVEIKEEVKTPQKNMDNSSAPLVIDFKEKELKQNKASNFFRFLAEKEF